jgi:integrase/recombinase XerD
VQKLSALRLIYQLVAAVTESGSLRDRTILVLMLHTGLRARELCTLSRAQVRLGKRSGTLTVLGKHNKQREIPLNATARAALLAYDPSLMAPSDDPRPLFLSEKRHAQLTERGLGYIVKKYAERAQVRDLRHRFGYRMAASVPLHRLAQLMGHDSLDTTMRYAHATKPDLQHDIERIAWR